MTTTTKSQTAKSQTVRRAQETEPSIAPVMKAAVIQGFGGPEVLELTEVPVAEPRPGHLLIKVNAAGLNRFDHYIREGQIAPSFRGRTSSAPMPRVKWQPSEPALPVSR